MTTIRLLSDLHLEFEEASDTDAFIESLDFKTDEVCVLAGDIIDGRDVGPLVKMVTRWPDTTFLMVPGNHEYFHTRIDLALGALGHVERAHKNFWLLHRSSYERVDLPKIVGATMWYEPPQDEADLKSMVRWADWQWIRNPMDIMWHAGADAQWLTRALNGSTIAVTHMLPHPCCTSPRWVGSPTNRFFVNDVVWNRLTGPKPKLWLFGHTHDSVDMTLGDTRFVCNPRGYAPDQFNPNFDPHLRIEVESE